MATYRVYQKAVNKKGLAPIYISFYLQREKIEIATGISLSPKFFDKDNGVVKKTHEFANDKNLIIYNIKARINDVLVKARLRNEKLSVTTFYKEYNKAPRTENFFTFCGDSQKLRFQELTIATIKKHKSCLGALRDFDGGIRLEELTPDTFRKFVLYLRNKRGNCEVTIRKTLGIISIYLNEAVRKELIKSNPIHEVKLRGAIENKAESLTERELRILKNAFDKRVFTGTTHDVLEFFLFMCFSSMHISDARSLQIEQISDNEIWYMRQKMLNIRPKVVRIPVCETLRQIILHKQKNRKEGKLWDGMIADQKVNSKLKEIAKSLGINPGLSAKFGRHTFATIFLRKTRDINTLKDIMGHSNIKQTLVYAHVLDSDKKAGIKVLDEI